MSNQQLDFCYITKREGLPPFSVNTPLYNSAMFNLNNNTHDNPIYSLLAKQKSIESFHESLLTHIEEMGFSLFQICHLERERFSKQTETDWPKQTRQALVTSAPTLSRNQDSGEKSFRISPVKSAVTQISIASSRSYTGELVDIFGSMDFHDTYSVSTPALLGEGFLILTVMAKGLSEETFQNQIEEHKLALLILIDAINAIGGLKFPNFIFDKRSTEEQTPLKKPMQALHWASQGYSHKEIAEKMSISNKTVNDHLRSARETLGAKSTGHAIRLAIEQSLIN